MAATKITNPEETTGSIDDAAATIYVPTPTSLTDTPVMSGAVHIWADASLDAND